MKNRIKRAQAHLVPADELLAIDLPMSALTLASMTQAAHWGLLVLSINGNEDGNLASAQWALIELANAAGARWRTLGDLSERVRIGALNALKEISNHGIVG